MILFKFNFKRRDIQKHTSIHMYKKHNKKIVQFQLIQFKN